MRVLISNDNPFAHYYIRMSIGRVLTAMGHEVVMWDINKKPVYDAFDQFEPDLFIGQTYNINRGLIQCLSERPHCRVIMKAADYGPRTHTPDEDGLHHPIDRKKYPVLMASPEEIDNVKKLQEVTGKPDFVYIHYNDERVQVSHKYWKKDFNIKLHSLMNAADIIQYTNGQRKSEYECDFCFVGGRWGYKSRTFDRWLIPLLHRNARFIDGQGPYRVKIFGNQPWGVPQYCGFIPDEEVKHVFSSANICINLSEPHSQDLGYDIIERPFKLLASKACVVSDHVEDLVKLFPNSEIAFAKTPEEFKNKIDYLLDHENERKEMGLAGYEVTLNNHTYFHRVRDIMSDLNLHDEAENCMNKFIEIKEKLGL